MRGLRALLAGPGPVVAPFAFDALQAKLAVAAGFEAVYMTGFGTAAARGFPDVGLLGVTEMAGAVATIARAVDVPVIADADTGYGTVLNVRRTVEEYERAGAAALHIEDQTWPKRCGFHAGKQVIPADEMVAKIRAACAARRDPELVVIGRTDALAPHGWDETERRARAYHAAGADLVFVDGIRTLADLDQYATRLADVPRLYSGVLPVAEATRRGFAVVICLGTMLATFQAVRDAMRELKASGGIAHAADLATVEEMSLLLGLADLRAFEARHT